MRIRDGKQVNASSLGTVPSEGSATFSSTFVDVPAYNCGTEAVQARRTGVGEYEIRFEGSPATLAVGSGIGQGPGAPEVNYVSFERCRAPAISMSPSTTPQHRHCSMPRST